jgi:hypothetical protein
MTTPSTTFALLNTTATTVNAFGAATTLALGTAGTTLVFGTTASLGTSTGAYRLAGSWMPQNAQTTAYTTVVTDANKHLLKNVSDTLTFTIAANSSVPYPVGTALTFATVSGTLTIAIASDAMYLMGSGSTGSRTLAQYGIATAVKIASTSWVISGTNLS